MNKDSTRIWNLLHDGEIEHIETIAPGRILLQIGVSFLRSRFSPQGDSFYVYLKNGTNLTFEDFADSTATVYRDWEELATLGIEILSAEDLGQVMSICTTLGILRTDYAFDSIFLEEGEHEISLDELELQSKAYWAE